MKKILIFLTVFLLICTLSSCEDLKEYELPWDEKLDRDSAFLTVDPFSLSPGESCFAIYSVYNKEGEMIQKSPCIVYASWLKEYPYTQDYKEYDENNVKYRIDVLPAGGTQLVFESVAGVWNYDQY